MAPQAITSLILFPKRKAHLKQCFTKKTKLPQQSQITHSIRLSSIRQAAPIAHEKFRAASL